MSFIYIKCFSIDSAITWATIRKQKAQLSYEKTTHAEILGAELSSTKLYNMWKWPEKEYVLGDDYFFYFLSFLFSWKLNSYYYILII